ncbi:hypothetical protein VQ643_16280, partial [Pseudomonas sp. F1_0610]|uniref:hypothetical protein n=1 Tax=Pseudomonas sp. F1_0610 TaxID=3114284 RepID=UPI0039C0E2AE
MKVFKWSTILTLFLLVGCSFMIKPTIWYESEVYHMKRFKVGIENLKRCIVSEVIPAEAQDNFTTLKTDNEELKRKVYESDVYKDYINRQNKIMYQDDKKIIIGDI